MAFARKFRWLPPQGATGTDAFPPITIGDDSIGHTIAMDPPSHERLGAQTVRLLEASYVNHLVLGGDNREDVITWRVDRDHTNPDTARKFSRLHHGEVPTRGILEDSGPGFTTLFLRNAIINTRCIEINGQCTVFEYTVRGGPWALNVV